ncbi:MAG TPA: FAD-binding and (Fe-S)-binding domain-containing protein [Chloroflexota bacterium]
MIVDAMFRHPSRLRKYQQRALQDILGAERVRFDARERRVYSHDTSVLPGVFRALAGRSLADGVVRPNTEHDLVRLVRYAQAERIPLIPRGKGTSGYGGAVPIRGGLIVDLTGLSGIVRSDPDASTVTVGAGTVWKDLEAALATSGLAPRLYPTSAPASTVGGWLAQGGAGIGSHAYGWFADNVVAARVVDGAGEVRDLRGDELRAIADAEGTTGIITDLTILVRPLTEQQRLCVAWRDPSALAAGLAMIAERALPIWSIHFVNPMMARLKNASPHYADEETRPASLPDDRYTAVVAYDTNQAELVLDGLRNIAEATRGEWLPTAVADYEWSERFRPMRLKRLGPSLVPVEVVVGTASLAPVLTELDRCIDGPLALEGLSVRGNEVVLLGFIPHDERRASYTFGYGWALSAIHIAERYGGRVYSTGRYFGSRAAHVLGSQRVEAIKRTRQTHDPAGILNPGKVVFANDVLGTLIGAARAAQPVVLRAANQFGRPLPPMERQAVRNRFLPEVAAYAYACAQCGYCVDICPQFQADGWESSGPRGKWFLLKSVLEGRDHFDNQMTDIFGLCTQCGKCDQTCQLELPIEPSWRKVRGEVLQGILTRTS